jgi:hypothetical protein
MSRVIVQAVSHRLSTVAARVRSQVRSSGICGGQSGSRAGFLRVLRFPLPILIPSIAPHSLIILPWTLYVVSLLTMSLQNKPNHDFYNISEGNTSSICRIHSKEGDRISLR